MRMFRKEEGFTLVELMVVVLIIGILVAIAIPVFNAARDNAQQKACFANMRTIDGSVQQWVAAEVGRSAADCTVAILVADGYLVDEPVCPADGSSYTITGGVVDACATHGNY